MRSIIHRIHKILGFYYNAVCKRFLYYPIQLSAYGSCLMTSFSVPQNLGQYLVYGFFSITTHLHSECVDLVLVKLKSVVNFTENLFCTIKSWSCIFYFVCVHACAHVCGCTCVLVRVCERYKNTGAEFDTHTHTHRDNFMNCIHNEIKNRLNSSNACYHAIQNLLFSSLLSKNIEIKVFKQ